MALNNPRLYDSVIAGVSGTTSNFYKVVAAPNYVTFFNAAVLLATAVDFRIPTIVGGASLAQTEMLSAITAGFNYNRFLTPVGPDYAGLADAIVAMFNAMKGGLNNTPMGAVWKTLYYIDWRAQPNQDITANGAKVIDGHNWTVSDGGGTETLNITNGSGLEMTGSQGSYLVTNGGNTKRLGIVLSDLLNSTVTNLIDTPVRLSAWWAGGDAGNNGCTSIVSLAYRGVTGGTYLQGYSAAGLVWDTNVNLTSYELSCRSTSDPTANINWAPAGVNPFGIVAGTNAVRLTSRFGLPGAAMWGEVGRRVAGWPAQWDKMFGSSPVQDPGLYGSQFANAVFPENWSINIAWPGTGRVGWKLPILKELLVEVYQ